MTFDWNRSEVLALSKETCTQCQGFGLRDRKVRKGAKPCNCVFRSVFRACYNRFRACAYQEKHMSRVRLEQVNGSDHRQSWGMKNEEYMADFVLIARKTLDEFEYWLFKYHYLLGADWKLCCRQLKMDRGAFFHSVYRLQQKLGRAYREVEPYPLYPLDEYFGGTVRGGEVKAGDGNGGKLFRMPSPQRQRLNPPLRKVA